MLDLPGQALLDKHRLLGGCVRLSLTIDAARLAAEIDALGASVWGTAGGRIGVHRRAEALYLRGHAPAKGNLPIADRPALSHLPYAREVIAMPGAPPQRCLLARLPPGETVALHVDHVAPYFSQTIRIHVPVVTNEHVFMVCDGLAYRMHAGEVWALNNSAAHGVWNADPESARTHLICDYVPSRELLALIARGDRSLGRALPEVQRRLTVRSG